GVAAAQPAPAAAAPAPTAPAAAPADRPPPTAAELTKLLSAVEAARKANPRETFDVAAAVAGAGSDPAAIHAWVRDRVAWVSYRGSLRGPVGTLMDRTGNSLDRSSLLAEMLRTAGKSARLARADLTPAQVAALRDRVGRPAAKPPADPPAGRDAIDDLVKNYGVPFGLDAAALRRYATDQATKAERTAEDLVGRTTEQSATLGDMLKGVLAAVPEKPAATDALAEHWWVQVEQDGGWVDLDPAADAAGKPAVDVKPIETIEWKPAGDRPPLAAERCHEVEVRVVAERWSAGAVAEKPVLRRTLRPSELIGQYVSVTYAPTEWPTGLNLAKEPSAVATVRSLAAKQHEWVPILTIGRQGQADGSVTDAGDVNPKADVNFLTKTGKVIGGAAGKAADLLDGLGDPPAQKPPKAAGVFSALWIDYEIRTPGEAPRTIRRQVFDLIGPAARAAAAGKAVPAPPADDAARLRRGLAMLTQTELLPLACQPSQPLVDQLAANTLLAAREPLLKVYAGGPAKEEDEFELLSVTPFPARLYTLAVARQALNPHRSRVYLDRVNLIALHHVVAPGDKDGLTVSVATDVVANDVAVRPGEGPDARAVRLAQGVLDTNAEAAVVEATTPAGGRRHGNAGRHMAARPNAADWAVVTKPDDAALDAAPLPPDDVARARAAVAAGQVVVVPRAAPSPGRPGSAWWRIDPATGLALGMGENGWGSELVEYQVCVAAVAFSGCLVGAVAGQEMGGGAKSRGKVFGVCAMAALGAALTVTTAGTATALVGFGIAGGAVGAGL
ncbi:MAG TPA: hypothetical protein VF796_23450, partial [Humisphaera sp.]